MQTQQEENPRYYLMGIIAGLILTMVFEILLGGVFFATHGSFNIIYVLMMIGAAAASFFLTYSIANVFDTDYHFKKLSLQLEGSKHGLIAINREGKMFSLSKNYDIGLVYSLEVSNSTRPEENIKLFSGNLYDTIRQLQVPTSDILNLDWHERS